MYGWENFIKEKKIIFFAAETIPSFSGSGIMAFRYARFLTQFCKSVEIVCFNYNKKLTPNEIVDNVKITRIPYYNKNIFFKFISLPILIFCYIKKTYVNDISFIYGTYMPGFEFILLSHLIFKKKTIYISTLLGDDDFNAILNKVTLPQKLVRKYLFKKISLYWSINELFRITFEKYYNTIPIVSKSQGVDLELFKNLTDKEKIHSKKIFNIPNNIFVILSCGFLIERKGYREIFENLSKLELPFLYVIAGQKCNDNYHRSSIQELNEMEILYNYGKQMLHDKIIFISAQKDMLPIYSIADVLLHGANREGLPNVVLEAMACKIPVIIRNLECYGNIFQNGYNALTYNDPIHINHHLTNLMNDYSLSKKISGNAYKKIVAEHSYYKITAELINKIK